MDNKAANDNGMDNGVVVAKMLYAAGEVMAAQMVREIGSLTMVALILQNAYAQIEYNIATRGGKEADDYSILKAAMAKSLEAAVTRGLAATPVITTTGGTA